MDMVYDSKELTPCHDLTEKGKEEYQKMLEQKADEILFKKDHWFLYWTFKIIEWTYQIVGLMMEKDYDEKCEKLKERYMGN